MKIKDLDFPYLDYSHSNVSLANSILKAFGAPTHHNTLPEADALLAEGYTNVIIMLLDAMGANILRDDLPEDSFFRTHLQTVFSSVYPPTTVASTTSVNCGLVPSEHAWLGWDCYYPAIDRCVTVFLNRDTVTGEPIEDYNVAGRFTPYPKLTDQVTKAGQGKGYIVSPFDGSFIASREDRCQKLLELCATPEKKYIYFYDEEPDSTMHPTGIHSEKSITALRTLEARIRQLCCDLETQKARLEAEGKPVGKTLLLITADHGHIDSAGVCLKDYPDVLECLRMTPTIEPRTLNFFVKPERLNDFPVIFNAHFGDKFLLVTRQEALDSDLFGPGQRHKDLPAMLGDYLALAVSDLSIYSTRKETELFIGVHAGLTKEEVEIPLIAVKI